MKKNTLLLPFITLLALGLASCEEPLVEEIIEHTVIFNYNYDTPTRSIKVKDGEKVPPQSDPTRTDYTFISWNTGSEITSPIFDFNTPIEADTTIWATWNSVETPVQYIVSFDLNYASSPSFPSITLNAGQTIDKPSDPSRTGYTFLNWTTDSAGTNAFTFGNPINANVSLFAQWEQIIAYYSVTFNFNYVGAPSNVVQRVQEGHTVSPLTFTPIEGRELINWTQDMAGKYEYNFSTIITGNLILYGQWKESWTTSVLTMVQEKLDFSDIPFIPLGGSYTNTWNDATKQLTIQSDGFPSTTLDSISSMFQSLGWQKLYASSERTVEYASVDRNGSGLQLTYKVTKADSGAITIVLSLPTTPYPIVSINSDISTLLGTTIDLPTVNYADYVRVDSYSTGTVPDTGVIFYTVELNGFSPTLMQTYSTILMNDYGYVYNASILGYIKSRVATAASLGVVDILIRSSSNAYSPEVLNIDYAIIPTMNPLPEDRIDDNWDYFVSLYPSITFPILSSSIKKSISVVDNLTQDPATYRLNYGSGYSNAAISSLVSGIYNLGWTPVGTTVPGMLQAFTDPGLNISLTVGSLSNNLFIEFGVLVRTFPTAALNTFLSTQLGISTTIPGVGSADFVFVASSGSSDDPIQGIYYSVILSNFTPTLISDYFGLLMTSHGFVAGETDNDCVYPNFGTVSGLGPVGLVVHANTHPNNYENPDPLSQKGLITLTYSLTLAV